MLQRAQSNWAAMPLQLVFWQCSVLYSYYQRWHSVCLIIEKATLAVYQYLPTTQSTSKSRQGLVGKMGWGGGGMGQRVGSGGLRPGRRWDCHQWQQHSQYPIPFPSFDTAIRVHSDLRQQNMEVQGDWSGLWTLPPGQGNKWLPGQLLLVECSTCSGNMAAWGNSIRIGLC